MVDCYMKQDHVVNVEHNQFSDIFRMMCMFLHLYTYMSKLPICPTHCLANISNLNIFFFKFISNFGITLV